MCPVSNSMKKLLDRYGDVVERFDHIKVRLIARHDSPFNLSIASARTCYSSKGLALPDEMEKSERAVELRDRIARETMEAGHLTTRQHAHFVFGLEGVSRNLIWQFLHSHPYYNSEQVSQRYVPIQGENWFWAPSDIVDAKKFHERAMETYGRLNEELLPIVSELYFSIFRARGNRREKYEKDVLKRAMEISRYVMPLSTTAYMYHTVSALTLYRYARAMSSVGLDEAIAVTMKMLAEVNKVDPDLIGEVPEPNVAMETSSAGHDYAKAGESNREFDKKLEVAGGRARLVSKTEGGEGVLRSILEAMPGVLNKGAEPGSVDGAWAAILDAEENAALGDSVFPVTMDEKSRVLQHIHYTFQKKLSHTADSQEQRHRTLPGSRPLLWRQISLEADYITPKLIAENEGVKAIYDDYMGSLFEDLRGAARGGAAPEALSYFLPNAFPVRYYESGDLLNFFHKWKSRLCYTAQEEIFYASLAEVEQVIEAHPFLKGALGPPCALRKTRKPRCPEGSRYCGVKVWNLELSQYERLI